MNVILWVVQALLALGYLLAGSTKFILPDEELTAGIPFPVLFVKFIGLCELAGAVGLILPRLLRIKPFLTPLAAAGLFIIMLGAVPSAIAVLPPDQLAVVALPATFLILDAFVAYGRWRLVP
ncbi:MAG: DoxX family protein [Chloroflexota bacterium]